MLGFRFLNFLIFTLVYGVSYLYQTWGKTPNEKKELQGQILSDYLIFALPHQEWRFYFLAEKGFPQNYNPSD